MMSTIPPSNPPSFSQSDLSLSKILMRKQPILPGHNQNHLLISDDIFHNQAKMRDTDHKNKQKQNYFEIIIIDY
ncbi:hypothetical protein [Photorhabdus tasmaniensis]|uniref:Uncharacterized protein n=1 Tax=Photorhabdus tasmaniensis TaxID=1004159 RepID=A0ABX0GNC7_9GAMM|nr:hypothetical protein [Photorhabdus tasmaniensis]NHB90042.1 hypothetical protein [Photorhabdus tasmaniensis]